MSKGLVYLYTGEGKTTNALGLALRAVGHGYRAVIVQFMKGWQYIGEYKIKDRLAPEYEIHQFGRAGFIYFKNPRPEDYGGAERALKFARETLRKKPLLMPGGMGEMFKVLVQHKGVQRPSLSGLRYPPYHKWKL